jgi:hypothetical protein
MPIAPRPIAETAGPFFPRVRVISELHLALNMPRGKVLRKSLKGQIYFARMRHLAISRDKNGLNLPEMPSTFDHGLLAQPKSPSSAPH